MAWGTSWGASWRGWASGAAQAEPIDVETGSGPDALTWHDVRERSAWIERQNQTVILAIVQAAAAGAFR